MYHSPVLLKETLSHLLVDEDGCYIDATFGGGGYTRGILERLSPKARVFAFDVDEEAVDNEREYSDERLKVINENFRYLEQFLRYYQISKVDGIVADLGISSHQIDEGYRGFSIRYDGPLDMRMSQKLLLTARTVVNDYDQEDLERIFKVYGELHEAKALAKAILKRRVEKAIDTSKELVELLSPLLIQKGKIGKLAQAFQAIRIEVNDELGALKDFLMDALKLLVPGGKICVVSYHSLEDRLVKRFFKSGNFEGVLEKDFYGNPQVPFKSIRKVIRPTSNEVALNSRSRSARLRVAEKI